MNNLLEALIPANPMPNASKLATVKSDYAVVLSPTGLAAAILAIDAMHGRFAKDCKFPGYSLIIPEAIRAYLVVERALPSAEPVAWLHRPTGGVFPAGELPSLLDQWEKRFPSIPREEMEGDFTPLITIPLGSANAEAVRVKKLAWGKTSYGTPEVITAVGIYRINESVAGGWSVTAKNDVLRDKDGRSNFATVELAQAAAQAHFDATIRAAIQEVAP